MNIWQILYPERIICVCCGRPSRGDLLCEACARELEELRLDGPREGASYRFDGPARKLIHRLKYENVAAAATILARAMALDAMKMHLPPDTVVTWVTMPETRRAMRGIDHGKLLAQAVALRLGKPARRLLIRQNVKAMHTQRGSDRAARMRNLKGLFAPENDLPRHILLVDDVLTTGATMDTCTACLVRGGATVYHLTAARVEKKRM